METLALMTATFALILFWLIPIVGKEIELKEKIKRNNRKRL